MQKLSYQGKRKNPQELIIYVTDTRAQKTKYIHKIEEVHNCIQRKKIPDRRYLIKGYLTQKQSYRNLSTSKEGQQQKLTKNSGVLLITIFTSIQNENKVLWAVLYLSSTPHSKKSRYNNVRSFIDYYKCPQCDFAVHNNTIIIHCIHYLFFLLAKSLPLILGVSKPIVNSQLNSGNNQISEQSVVCARNA